MKPGDLSGAFFDDLKEKERVQALDNAVLDKIDGFFQKHFGIIDTCLSLQELSEKLSDQCNDAFIAGTLEIQLMFLAEWLPGLAMARAKGVFDRNAERRDEICDQIMQYAYKVTNAFDRHVCAEYSGALNGMYAAIKTPRDMDIDRDLMIKDMGMKLRIQEGQQYEI